MDILLDTVPALSLLSIAAAILLIFGGWISSVIAVFRSEKGKGLRFLTTFPLTNPIGLFVLMIRDRKATTVSIITYTAGVLALPVGGTIASLAEENKLKTYESVLSERGISLEVSQLIPEPAPSESNIWEHPFLAPMSAAAKYDDAGREARDLINSDHENSPYFALERPKPLKGLQYDTQDSDDALRSTQHSGNALQRMHSQAIAILAQRDGFVSDANTPATWNQIGELISQHYSGAEEATRLLEDALKRPYDQYPYQWEKAFEMLLPHLARLKAFSLSSTLRSSGAATRGDAAETFRHIQLGLKLAKTGDADFLISRLVQFAQTTITLDALRVAQQFHVGSEEDWRSVAESLNEWDFPSEIAPSLNAERAFGQAMIKPMADGSFFGAVQHINRLDTMAAVPEQPATALEAGFRLLANIILTSNSRAAIYKNWRQAVEAYQSMIDNVAATRTKSQTVAWNQCPVPELDKPVMSYGIFAKMLLPALETAFKKAIETQHQIEVAKVAVALERYYIAHQAYPESVSQLSPQFLPEEPKDPMTAQAWRYELIEQKGFLLYSVGRNGIDQAGIYRPRRGSRADHEDDRGWYVSPTVLPLPEFTLRDLPTKQTEEDLQTPDDSDNAGSISRPDQA